MADRDKRDQNRQPSLEALGERIESGRKAAGLSDGPKQHASYAGAGEGLRVSVELVVSVAVGTGLGYWIGNAAGFKTVGIVIGFLFGIAAGFRAVYRHMMASAATFDDAVLKKKDVGPDDGDDD